MTDKQQLTKKLLSGAELSEGQIVLDLDGFHLAVRSNNPALLEKLGIYFAHTLNSVTPHKTIIAIDADVPDLGIDFIDWTREAGKSGRKDAYCDLKDARLLHKVRTGMVFLQSEDHLITRGPALENDNQVINFINAQYMNHLQQHDALICHAAGLVANNKALGIAGFSGGGKSTLMLHLLPETGLQYLTNDRLFIDTDLNAIGIPKMPRVNPGTLLNDENLTDLLSEQRREELKSMPVADLWDLEEKYDVMVEDVYGDDKIFSKAPLGTFLLLNWERNSPAPFQITEINIRERQDLLGTIMKSPGPFYQLKDKSFHPNQTQPVPEEYIEKLSQVKVYEATGKVDFMAAKEYCLQHILT